MLENVSRSWLRRVRESLGRKQEMVEKVYARPIIPLLLSLMAGIVAGSRFPGFTIPACVAVLLSGARIVCRIKRKRTDGFLPLFLFCALGYLSIQPWVAPKFPENHVFHYADAERWKVTGTVRTLPFESHGRLKFVVDAETLSRDGSSFAAAGKIRVTLSGTDSRPCVGDRVDFVSKLRRTRNFSNPGGFDYERYMAYQRLWVTTYVPGDRFTLPLQDRKQGLKAKIENARGKIADLIDGHGAPGKPGDARGVLKALIIGDRSGIEQSLQDAFNRAGVSHLLAISGLHVGIVATASFFIFRWILSFFRPLLWRAWTRKGAAILSFFPVLSYGLIAGMSPSTQRAVIMVTVFLMTFIFEREQDLINTLALAAMLILGLHPPSLFSVSFQLSFVAVLSIVYGLSKIPIRLSNLADRKGNVWIFRMRQKLLAFMLVSLLAILGTTPLAMHYFNQVSFVGLPANLVLVPLVGFVAVPLGLVSVLLYPMSSYLADLTIGGSAGILSWAIELVKLVAGIPFAAAKTVTPNHFEMACCYVLAWGLLNMKRALPETLDDRIEADPLAYLRGKHREFARFVKQLWQNLAAGRRTAAIAVAVAVAAFCLDGCYWLNKRFWHDDLRVTIMDIGQANAALLELPRGHRILVDGGGFSDNTIFDVGERIIAPLLWRKKIRTVDTLIVTHPNSDHLNGLLYIAEHFNVGDVWMNDDAPDTLGYSKFRQIMAKERIDRLGFEHLPRVREINGVALRILYPPADVHRIARNEKWRDVNNNSLVVKVSFGCTSFLFPGDITARAEREVVSLQGNMLKSTVLLAPHHGSKSSSSNPFLDKTEPEYVVISAGWNNRFGFPNPTVLERYRRRGYRILNTATHGAISMVTDGEAIRIEATIDSGGGA